MRKAAENDTQVHLSSGNVFADLGIPDAEEYMAKSKMAVQIFQIIKNRRLTQAAAGKLLGITQPKVSAPLMGDWTASRPSDCSAFLTRSAATCKSPSHVPVHEDVAVSKC